MTISFKTLSLTGASVAALLLAGAANAADLPDFQEPVIAPMAVAPLYSFSGAYVGLNAGYIDGDLDTTLFDGTGASLGSFDGDDEGGFIGGVTAGFNAQFNQFVLGVEGDVSYVNFDAGDDTSLFPAGTFAAGVAGPGDLDIEVDYLATLRGRAGVAIDRFMVYGTGGLAFTSIDIDYSNPSASFNVDSDDDLQVGYAVGAGVEGLITENVTAKLEYLYTAFDDESVSFNIPATGASRSIEADFDSHVIRAGINYKFSGF